MRMTPKPYDVANGIDKDGKAFKYQVHPKVSLNRSQHWAPADGYLEARALAPDPYQPIR